MEQAFNPLLWLVLLPAIAGAISPALGKLSGKARDWTSALLEFIVFLLALSLVLQALREGLPALSLLGLSLDPLSAFMALTVALLGFSATLYSVKYMAGEEALDRYYLCLHFFVAGMLAMVLADNLASIYVALEAMTVASCILVAHRPGREAAEAGYKYVVLCTLGAVFVLLSILTTYQAFGTLQLAELKAKLPADSAVLLPYAGLFAILGLGLKAGMVPLHAWLPDAHAEAPSPVSSLLSGAMIHTAAFALMKILVATAILTPGSGIGNLLVCFGLISMVVGTMLALTQTDMKRMMAYSSVDHIGFILVGLGLATPLGLLGSLYHILTHGLGKGLLFLCAGAIMKASGARNFRELGGLSTSMPATTVLTLVAVLSLAGVPPFAGFMSKFLVCMAAFEAGYPALVIVMLVVSVTTLAYLLRFFHAVFMGEAKRTVKAKEVSPAMLAPMLFLGFLCILFGVYPTPLVEMLGGAVGFMLGGA